MRAPLIRPTAPVARRDVRLRPSGIATAWLAPGLPRETLAVPGVALAPHEVLVAIEMSTICASDLRTVQGRAPTAGPLVLGHESIGRIVALGDEGASAVDGAKLRPGDRVVWSPTVSCGGCAACAAGRPQKCRGLIVYGRARIEPRWELTGTFASHVHLREGTAIVRVPEGLPATALAPVGCATARAWAAVSRGAALRGRALPDPAVQSPPCALAGERIVVLGAGLTGLTAAVIAAENGGTVLLADPDSARRAFAERFGIVAGAPEDIAAESADLVIAASGTAAALDVADAGGTVVLVGDDPTAEPVSMDPERVVHGLLTVAGVSDQTGIELRAAVSFLAGRGRTYPFADAVGTVHPLSCVDAALAQASAPDAPLRVGLSPR